MFGVVTLHKTFNINTLHKTYNINGRELLVPVPLEEVAVDSFCESLVSRLEIVRCRRAILYFRSSAMLQAPGLSDVLSSNT